MNKSDLVTLVAGKAGITKKAALVAVNVVLSEVDSRQTRSPRAIRIQKKEKKAKH